MKKLKVFFIFLGILSFAVCNSPNGPGWIGPPDYEEEEEEKIAVSLVIFQWENPVQKSQVLGEVHLKGRLLNVGNTIANHWHGIPVAYKDLDKTIRVELRLHSNYPDGANERFVPQQNGGHGKWINLYTESPYFVDDIKVLEIKMEYDLYAGWPGEYGEIQTQTITYIFK